MSKVPVSFILDDGGPVNMAYMLQPANARDLLIPMEFTKRFAEICRTNGVRGKYSVVPMPAGIGRLDQKSKKIPAKHIKDHIRIIKKEIEPALSITPEILTHFRAYDLDTGAFLKIFENVYFSTCTAEEIARYVALSLEILLNTGLNPTGVTSPWMCGLDNEENYAKGIGMAFKQVKNADSCFYFLHARDHVQKPVLMCDSPETGKVVSIPNLNIDAFWTTVLPSTAKQARASMKEKMDSILSADGKTGKMREQFEKGLPMVFISHWQSLYSDGRCIGLEGFETLVKRINRVFGKQIEWLNFEEIAARKIAENQM